MNYKLRPWAITDITSLAKYANNWSVAKNLTDKFPHPYTEADAKAFIEFANSETPIHFFAIEVNNEAVGGIGIHPQEDIYKKNAELGYWLAEPFWGKGIIGQAIKQMIDFAFTTYDIERLFARPFGANIASQKVLEKNGFVLEASFAKTIYKQGEYHDELVYAVRRENWAG
jgi:[ribosomal protein S5]-alanine N-acetyltransferase